MVPATQEFLSGLREVAAQTGIVLIFDEVVTFPIHPHGAQGLYGIRPDLTTLGKAIGGGLPLGAFGGRRDIMDLVDPEIDPMTQMRHASTLGGTPACLAAGLAQVRQLTPEKHDRLAALGERLRGGAREVAARLHVPLKVTGISQLFGLHWTEHQVTDFDSAMTSDKAVTSQIAMALLNEGYLMFKSAIGTVSAPMTDEDIDGFVNALERVLCESGVVS